MSLFHLFSKPKVEKLRGYVETGLSTSPPTSINSSRMPRSDMKTTRGANVESSPPRSSTAMSFRSQAGRLQKATPPLEWSSPGGLSWSPLPLHMALSEAIHSGLLHISNADGPSSLRAQMSRQGSTLNLRAYSHQANHSGRDFAVPASRRSSSSNGHLHIQSSLLMKMFVLCASGYLLQYSERGSDDRLPERVLQLSKDSAVFACDLVPGRPYVLQVAQALDAQGVTVVGPSSSLFTRLGLRGAASRRMTSSMLLVLDDAMEQQRWQSAVRRGIELLGGYMDFSKAVERGVDEKRRSSYRASSISDKLRPRSPVSVERASAHEAARHSQDEVLSPSPRQSSDAFSSVSTTKTMSPKSHRMSDLLSDSASSFTASTTSPVSPMQSIAHAKHAKSAAQEGYTTVERKDSVVTPQRPDFSHHVAPSKRHSSVKTYHVPSQGSLRTMNSFSNMPPSMPPTIKEDMQAESPVLGRPTFWSQTGSRAPVPLPIRAEGQIINRSTLQLAPSPEKMRSSQSRKHSPTAFHVPLKVNPSISHLTTPPRNSSPHPVDEHSTAVHVLDQTDETQDELPLQGTTSRPAPVKPQKLPFKLRAAVQQPMAVQKPAAVQQSVAAQDQTVSNAAPRPIIPPRAPTPKLSFFPMPSPPPPSIYSPPSRVYSPGPSGRRGLRRPASFQVRPNEAPPQPSFRSVSASHSAQNGSPSRPFLHNSRSTSNLVPNRTREPLSETLDPNVISSTRSIPATQSYHISTLLPPDLSPRKAPAQKPGKISSPPSERRRRPSSAMSNAFAEGAPFARPPQLSLPALDLGIPVVGLAPPAPPPQAPLPNLPPGGSRCGTPLHGPGR